MTDLVVSLLVVVVVVVVVVVIVVVVVVIEVRGRGRRTDPRACELMVDSRWSFSFSFSPLCVGVFDGDD